MNLVAGENGKYINILDADGNVCAKIHCPISWREIYHDYDDDGNPELESIVVRSCGQTRTINKDDVMSLDGVAFSGDFEELIQWFNDNASCCCKPEDMEEEVEREELKIKNFELKDGESICLSDLITQEGMTAVAGFDFDLKKVDGDEFNGFMATTSQAQSSGDHGSRDLDPGGSFQLVREKYSDDTYLKLGEQCFAVAEGSIAELLVEFII